MTGIAPFRRSAGFWPAAAASLALLAALAGCGEAGDDAIPSDEWYEAYADRYLSPRHSFRVTSAANERDFPTKYKTTITATHGLNDRISGRWVIGADETSKWVHTDAGGYVWEGNLIGPGKKIDPVSAPVIEEVPRAAGPDDRDSRPVRKTPAPAPEPEPEPEPEPAPSAPPATSPPSLFPVDFSDGRLVKAIARAVPEAALASEIADNADIVTVAERPGYEALVWTLCRTSCSFEYSAAIHMRRTGKRMVTDVCIHDGRLSPPRRWFRNGRMLGDGEGLCPSALAAPD